MCRDGLPLSPQFKIHSLLTNLMIPKCLRTTRQQKRQRNIIFKAIALIGRLIPLALRLVKWWMVLLVASSVRGIFRKRQRPCPARDDCDERAFKLLRDLIDLSYQHEKNDAKFHKKFRETVGVDSLVERGIVNPDAVLERFAFDQEFGEMRRKDAEYIALRSRFSSRELTVIYNYRIIDSVYSKHSRVRKRVPPGARQYLDKQPERPKPNTPAE